MANARELFPICVIDVARNDQIKKKEQADFVDSNQKIRIRCRSQSFLIDRTFLSIELNVEKVDMKIYIWLISWK